MGNGEPRVQVLPGTLDMLILRTLVAEPRHGHGIATTIQHGSNGALLVDHGSLYPSLQRLERSGLIDAEWGVSKNNRRARFYRLTPKGRRKLFTETGRWSRAVRAVMGVMQLAESKGAS
jgi:PadR family transcriptional regulator PadR